MVTEEGGCDDSGPSPPALCAAVARSVSGSSSGGGDSYASRATSQSPLDDGDNRHITINSDHSSKNANNENVTSESIGSDTEHHQGKRCISGQAVHDSVENQHAHTNQISSETQENQIKSESFPHETITKEKEPERSIVQGTVISYFLLRSDVLKF